MCLTAAEEGVDDGCSDGCVMVAAEEVVLSSDGERADCILDSVVVDVISAVKDITAQAWEKSIGVDQSLSHSGFRSEASGHGVHPDRKSVV